MEIVTGHRGTPHITPYKVRDFNIGIVGAEDYVINSGSELEAQLVSNNRIDIKDGSICMQGTHAVIPKNINDELTIENGMQGEKRIDLIVARYEKVADSGVESVNTVVLHGTPSKETPNVPGHVVGDIRNGDLKHEMPLYEVELDGINITEVRPVFKKLVSAAEQQKMIESLNGKLKVEHFLTINNYTTYLTIGDLRGGRISNIHGVKAGNVVTLYVQINDITAVGSDVTIFTFKDAYRSKYAPFTYAVHSAFISNYDNTVYIGQFADAHFSMAISGVGTINTSKKCMILFSVTYITQS